MQNNINIKKYSPFNIEQFKNWLRDMKEKNDPKFFEVYVDDFKVVPRTENPEDFDSHQQYVDDETMKIRVLIYNTAGSNRYTQTIFKLKEKQETIQHSQPLGEVQMKEQIQVEVKKGVEQVKEQLLCEQIKKELLQAKEQLKESKEYSEKLSNYIESLKEKISRSEGIDKVINSLKDFAPHFLKMKTPANQNLSGNNQSEKKPEEQASFKAKTEGAASLTEQEKEFIAFGKSIHTNFPQEEFTKVLSIIDAFAKDKSAIDPVMSLLNINNNKTQKQNGKV